MRSVGVAALNANSVKKQSINAKVSRPNVADWQYLGVDKITRRLEWNPAARLEKDIFVRTH